MSGVQLTETLKSLGYRGTLDPNDSDWMFENEKIAPVLKWFCNNVTPKNVLSKKELQEYEKMCQSGEAVYKGRQLDEALSILDFKKDDAVSEEVLKEEVEQLEKSLKYYRKQKQKMSKRRQLLGNHLTSQSQRLSKMSGVGDKMKQKYKESLEHTQAANTKMNDTLDKLTSSVTDLTKLYKTPQLNTSLNTTQCLQTTLSSSILQSSLPCRTGSPAMFLSQVPVQQFYSAEENFTTQLTAFTRKQFFQGIAEMASCGGDSRFEILEVSDPDSLLVRGESSDVNLQDCKDLARLQNLYIKSETDRLQALCEMKRLKGQNETAKEILQSVKDGTFCTDTLKNKERIDKLRTSTQSIQRDFQSLGDREVPQLIQECREAEVLRVLTGDYNLKLARQDYFTSNQDKVINQLVLQRSRNEFLTMALEVELRQHHKIHHILTSLDTLLNNQFLQWQARMGVMSDSSLTPARHKRETIDSRDKSTARLFHMLDSCGGTERQLFLTYSSLVENAENLDRQHSHLQRNLEATNSAVLDDLKQLEKSVTSCEELLYRGSSTVGGLPPLTPRSIQDNIVQLLDMLKQLEQGIMDVVKDVDQKKKMLKSDPLLVRKRKLFTYFFTNPAKLHQSLEEISARLQAESCMDNK